MKDFFFRTRRERQKAVFKSVVVCFCPDNKTQKVKRKSGYIIIKLFFFGDNIFFFFNIRKIKKEKGEKK